MKFFRMGATKSPFDADIGTLPNKRQALARP
jgi:hypothetical protein